MASTHALAGAVAADASAADSDHDRVTPCEKHCADARSVAPAGVIPGPGFERGPLPPSPIATVTSSTPECEPARGRLYAPPLLANAWVETIRLNR